MSEGGDTRKSKWIEGGENEGFVSMRFFFALGYFVICFCLQGVSFFLV